MSSVRERYGKAFWRAHHEAWVQSELNQREYCEAYGIPLKAFGNWRVKFKAEPQTPPRKVLYRRGRLSHTLSHGLSHGLSHDLPIGPIIRPAREGRRRTFSESDKQQILEEAMQPGARLSNAKNPRSVSDPGPQNPAIRDQFPGAFSPPATDVGSMPLSWASFNNAPRRIQNGGWARQVTQDSFAVADIISGDLIARRRKLAECASTHRLLTMFAFRENAEVGGLIGWAARVADLSTRTALFVDPILKGARPPELPIEQQPTIVELINNLKTAKIRGPALPPTLHAQFNEMID